MIIDFFPLPCFHALGQTLGHLPSFQLHRKLGVEFINTEALSEVSLATVWEVRGLDQHWMGHVCAWHCAKDEQDVARQLTSCPDHRPVHITAPTHQAGAVAPLC